MTQFAIGNITLKSNILLAPLAGFSEAGMRSLCASFGAGLTVTEMVSAAALHYESIKTRDLLVVTPEEKIVSVQIFGSDPGLIAEAIQNPLLERFDIIDFNAACPMSKIVKNGEGSALLKDRDKFKSIIKAMRAATNKPITVKLRLGFTAKNIVAPEYAKLCEEYGVNAIAVHGRTREQFYSGIADYGEIKKVVDAVNIPVIANGDILTRSDAERVQHITGAKAVMIGRGAIGKPYIFADISGEKREPVDLYSLINKHVSILASYFGEYFAVTNIRKHLGYYLKGVRHSRDIKLSAMSLTDVASLMSVIEPLKQIYV